MYSSLLKSFRITDKWSATVRYNVLNNVTVAQIAIECSFYTILAMMTDLADSQVEFGSPFNFCITIHQVPCVAGLSEHTQ